jgi:hypothetical protein
LLSLSPSPLLCCGIPVLAGGVSAALVEDVVAGGEFDGGLGAGLAGAV